VLFIGHTAKTVFAVRPRLAHGKDPRVAVRPQLAHDKELPAANGGRRRQNFTVSPILAHGKDCIQRVFYFRRAFFLGTRQMD
jgi:hypothetical protein